MHTLLNDSIDLTNAFSTYLFMMRLFKNYSQQFSPTQYIVINYSHHVVQQIDFLFTDSKY